MKYNKGDRVRIVSRRTPKMNENGKMDEYLGTIMTINRSFPGNLFFNSGYKMEEDEGNWNWDDEMIEGLADECDYKEGDKVNAKDEDIIYENLVYLFTMEDGTKICVRKHELEWLKGAFGYKEVWKAKEKKKERKLLMTDQEWIKFKKNNNLN